MDPVIARHLQALAESSELRIALFDEHDVHRWVNARYAEDFDVPLDGGGLTWMESIRRNHRAGRGVRIVTEDIEAWLTSARSRRGKQPWRTIEADMIAGHWLLMTETLQPDGWMLVVGIDVTGLRQDTRTLRHARDLAMRESITDPLTSVGNRRYAMERLAQTLQQAQSLGGEPAVVALLDLDHFKRINDTHGHATGDDVLRHFARLMLASTRRDDICARLGGEEFVLVLPRTPLAIAHAVVERLLARARSSVPFDDERRTLRYSVSAGLAAAMPPDTPETLLARADAALYRAKLEGRDRVRVSD